MKTCLRYIVITTGILSFALSCRKVQKVTDVIIKPTERELYHRNFDEGDSLFSAWNTAFNLRKFDSLKIELPFVEQGQFSLDRNEVYSFITQVRQGERLIAKLDGIADSTKVFINIYPEKDLAKDDETQVFDGILSPRRQVLLENGTDEYYKIVIQPELGLSGNYILKLYTEPTYAFPVAGKTSKAIKSFWGASRDGGRRSHKGVDIFAKRGTPVVAIADGRIRKTGDYGLGGKQVWVRENLFGNSLYYAHLDSIGVKSGIRVKIGDTLGFVGNTGNAKTTAPHLHFGIYKGYYGAVDPLPFIKETELLIYDEDTIAKTGELRTVPANIRIGPSTDFEITTTTTEKFKILILGKTKGWYHIQLESGIIGFIHQSLINEESSPIII